MSHLSENASYLMSNLLTKVYEAATPPHKFHPAWCFITDDEDDLPEYPPEEPYVLSELTEWAQETLSRGNRFRLWSYQMKSLEGRVYCQHEIDSDVIEELKLFFSENPQWLFEGTKLTFRKYYEKN
jgi:hypothetical protein